MSKKDVSRSKFLSLALRHQPEVINVKLDENGWIDVEILLAAMQKHGRTLSREDLDRIVQENDKKRFAFSEDGKRIRASQGHSVEVDLALTPQVPPDKLYHGTVDDFIGSILHQGLRKGQRQHVHLSADIETANKVGQRRGKPIILEIAASEMQQGGYAFYLSANGVWLVDSVPPQFISRKN